MPTITDTGTIQWIAFLATSALAGILVSITICIRSLASAWAERERCQADAAEADTRTEELRLKQVNKNYDLALLNRVGSIDPVSINIPQSEIDALALAQIKQRIQSMVVKADVKF